MEDEPRAGRLSTSKTDDNVERVTSLVRSDRRLTLRMISFELNLNRFNVHQILTQDLDMRKVCAKMVPKNLRMSKSKIKSMLICFFDSQGIVHKEFVPPGQTVIQTFYREVLERLGKRVARVRPGIARTWMLHHDNIPCHTAVSINEFLAEKSIPVVPQPPYSPDLSPCDFFLFPWLKNHLKGRHFGTSDNIQKSVTDELKGIPAEAFQHCYEWKQRLRRCVAAQGNYFEGDNLDL